MKSILIIDDEKNFAESLSLGLKSYGYHVEFAETGEQGLMNIKKNQYDCILCDINLSGINGWDVAAKILSLNSAMKIIFMSGRTSYVSMRRNYDFPLLIKPFKISSLIDILEMGI